MKKYMHTNPISFDRFLYYFDRSRRVWFVKGIDKEENYFLHTIDCFTDKKRMLQSFPDFMFETADDHKRVMRKSAQRREAQTIIELAEREQIVLKGFSRTEKIKSLIDGSARYKDDSSVLPEMHYLSERAMNLFIELSSVLYTEKLSVIARYEAKNFPKYVKRIIS